MSDVQWLAITALASYLVLLITLNTAVYLSRRHRRSAVTASPTPSGRDSSIETFSNSTLLVRERRFLGTSVPSVESLRHRGRPTLITITFEDGSQWHLSDGGRLSVELSARGATTSFSVDTSP